jgi:hypothetical protein
MTVRNRKEIVMADIERGHRRQDSRDVAVVDERAATLAALSDELSRRLSKHPLPSRRRAPERSRWRPLWRMGILSALAVAAVVVGLAVMPLGMIWNGLERFRGQPAEAPLGASSITTVSTAAAATAPSPQPTAPPIDPPTTASAPVDGPVHDRTTAASRGDLPLVDDRELTWTEVHELQVRLRALRFDPGPLDGVRGPLTSAAVRRFQESQGYLVTGDIGLRTLILVRQATGAPE